MKINVWGINYSPELTGIAVYNTGMCDYFAENGDEVTMVCGFPYYPSWKKSDSDRLALFRQEYLKDVSVQRCFQYVPARPSTVARVLHELSFVFTSFLRQLALPAADVYVVVSPPLLLGLAAWLVSVIKKRPYCFHVQDLQPDSALSLAMLPKFLEHVLYAIEKFAYSKAKIVSGISSEMLDSFRAKGVPDTKIQHFPNWVDLPHKDHLPLAGAWKARQKVSAKTQVVSYAGNIGVKQGLEIVVKAAEILKDRPDTLFVIAGDGAQKPHLENLVSSFHLSNVLMLPVLPEKEYEELLADSDVCLITQLPGTGASFFPSKLLKILALERPVVTNADAETTLYAQIQQASFGLSTASADETAFASAIAGLLAEPGLRARMGACGKRYVAQFERRHVLSTFRRALALSSPAGERPREHTLAQR